jgi:amino acid transporter
LGYKKAISYFTRFTYSSIFAGQNLTAANLALYWGIKPVWQIILYFVTPGIMVVINMVGVGTFGWIEAIGGILKLALVIGTTIVLYVIAAESEFKASEICTLRAG